MPHQTKKLSHVASVPICYHDNPVSSHHAVECSTVWYLCPALCLSLSRISHLQSHCLSRRPRSHSIFWASIFTLRWKHPRLIRGIFHTMRSQLFFFHWKGSLGLGLPLETWMHVCFCSLSFSDSFFLSVPGVQAGFNIFGSIHGSPLLFQIHPCSAFFFPLPPPGMHRLSSGVHAQSTSVFKRKFKKSTWHYVVLEVHHFFHHFKYSSLSSGV